MSYANTSLLLPMNGANNGTVFTDYSPVQKTVAVFGDAKTSTAQSKYYGSSGAFDGTGDYISLGHNTSFEFNSDAYYGVWIYNQNTGNIKSFVNKRNVTRTLGWTIFKTTGDKAQLTVQNSSGSAEVNLVSAASLTLNTWVHVAASRDGNTFRLFINGIVDGSVTASFTYGATTDSLTIGRDLSDAARDWNGFMQDAVMVHGSSVYTDNFTPPARLVGTIDNSAVGASKILDINGNPAERTVFAVPRAAPTRIWSDVSNASGEFEIWAPAGVDHSVVALADETDLREDLVHRVIPA